MSTTSRRCRQWADNVGGARSVWIRVAIATMLTLVWGDTASVAHGQVISDPDVEPPACLTGTTGTISVTPGTISLGGSVTVRWSVQVPTGCAVTQTLNTVPVARSGSETRQPMANASYVLRAKYSSWTRTLASASVVVALPEVVRITANNQAPLLVQALGTPSTVIIVDNHVQIDLSWREEIPIAPGVQLFGGRSAAMPGARLYTTSFPKRLFRVGAHGWPSDNVRISGLRIDGGEMGVADEDTESATGIMVSSSLNVEIDNNEIYGWRGAAISVHDELDRIALAVNPMAVRIHDNYIHHNQHHLASGKGAIGYGVDVGYGAYVVIEKNVFDWNRHAIASDWREGTGYLAYRNLVLDDGGLSYWAGTWIHTHMFDVHGRDSCGVQSASCGPAGEYFDIRDNTFLYNSGHAFKLRGTPSIRADVANNVFKHDALWSSYFPIHTLGALAQTESGLTQWGNALRVDESDNFGQCDFDADGVNDRFFATGATWWYSSGGSGHWRYLNTSTRRLSELTLGYFDGDRTCDVKVGSMISSGGRGPWRPLVQDILWQNATGQLAVWRMDGGRIVGESYPAIVDSSWRVRGSGDFNGDGQGDVLWQNTAGQVAIWYMSGGSRIGDAYPGAQVPAAWRMQGVGDFDGDGVSDILWRDDSGQLAIWFKGDPGAWLKPPAYPGYGGRPEPVPLDWLVNGVADFDGDGRTDILWRGSDGQVAIWHMAGGVRIGERYAKGATSLAWRIEGTADFDADGRADILWRDTSGQLAIWLGGDETRAVYPSYNNTGAPVDPAWRVQDLGDYNADGRADLLWRRNDGGVAIWFMAGGRVIGDAYARAVDSSWQIRTVLSRSR